MTQPAHDRLRLRDLLLSFVVSRALQIAAELGVADALADGPLDCATLAGRVGADPDTLSRLLRALAAHDIFRLLPDGRYANTALSEHLRDADPGSLRGMARMYGDPAMWRAFEGLEHSVRSGEPAFAHMHGVPPFDYLAAHPATAQRFDAAMVSSSSMMNPAIVEAYDWGEFGTLVDVAGGAGSTLAAILAAAPKLNGVLFDLLHVIERARVHLAELDGVGLDLRRRCRFEVGSFFERVPAGADAYFMKHILHDWSDGDCLRILARCREAMPAHARLLVCEKVIPPGNAPHYGKTVDLIMLALMHGGRERSASEWESLFERAGMRLARTLPTRAENSLLEVVKA
jgi:hypothetical protein